jgi:uncharacterized membrane protein
VRVFFDFAVVLAGAGVAALVGWLAAGSRRTSPSWLVHLVPLAGVLWAVTFAWLAVARHNGFRSHAYDLGIYDQVVWNSSQGRLFENSIMFYLPHFLGDHFSLALLAFVPLYWLWPDPRTLLVVQPFLLALAPVITGYAAGRILKSALAGLVVGGVYLLHPGQAFTALFDFHDLVLAPPLLALALTLLLGGRSTAFALALLPVLLVKEEMGIVVAAVGLWAALFTPARRRGLLLAALGGGWTLLVLFVVIPLFNPEGQYYYLRRYFEGGAPTSIAAAAERLLSLTAGLGTPERLAYLGHLLLPFALLPLAGTASLMALPTLGYHLLSPEFPFAFIEKHYSVLVLPFLAFGAIQALRRLADRSHRAYGAALAALGASGVLAYGLLSPGPLARHFQPERFAPNPRAEALQEAIRRIPPEASVLAQTDLVPHLTHRRQVYMFPEAPTFGGTDYVLLDLEGNKYPLSNPEDDYDRELLQYLLSPAFETIYERDNVLLLRRRAMPLEPPYRLEASFGRRVLLEGFDLTPRELQPGHSLTLTLWWRALTDGRDDLTLFIHLLGPDGQRVTQLDVAPTESWFGTSRWQAGRRFRVPYTLVLPSDAPRGEYQLQLGLYSVYSQRRLGLVGGGTVVELPLRPFVGERGF